jgi:hypothetical protein
MKIKEVQGSRKWVDLLPSQFKVSGLDQHQINRLNELAFEWDGRLDVLGGKLSTIVNS